jgi:peptidyl-prolyl cis-trans isomerase SurA
MIQKLRWLVPAVCLSVSALAQTDNPVIFTIGDESVTKQEFSDVYTKNNINGQADFSRKSIEDYLDLYINFRLKVKEAYALRIDTMKSLNDELDGYRNQLAQTYLVDKDAENQLVMEAYNRMKKEIHVEHIMVKCDANASPADTLAAYNKALDLRKQLLAGKDFNDLAKQVSDDPSAKDNGGDLGYITALQTVYPFETAAYNTVVGQISQPVRSRFGYHIIKVLDVRDARGQVEVEHIFVKTTKEMNAAQMGKAKQKIDSLYNLVKGGSNFEDVARANSEDPSSASNGGLLPEFGAGQMVASFEDAAFSLKNPGDISSPIQSPYGWHIIKLIDKKPLGSFDSLQDQIRRQVEHEARFDMAKQAYFNDVKKWYAFTENASGKKAVYNLLDTSFMKGNWNVKSTPDLTGIVFTLTDKQYKPETKNFTEADFVNFIQNNQKRVVNLKDKQLMFDELYKQFTNNSLLDFEQARLENQYPAFKSLMTEYRNGVLLFELTDEKVWSRAVKDTTGLLAFYNAHKENYLDSGKANITEYDCKNKDVMRQVEDLRGKGWTDDKIKAKLDKKDTTMLGVQTVLMSKADFPMRMPIQKWKKGAQDTSTQDSNREMLSIVNDIESASPRPLDEVRGYVVADYQDYLEKQWIADLRQKYPVTVNQPVVDSLIKN